MGRPIPPTAHQPAASAASDPRYPEIFVRISGGVINDPGSRLRLTAALSRALIDFHPQDIHRSAAIAEEVQFLSVGGPHRIPIQRKIVGKLDRSASAGRDRLYFPLAAACQSPISDPIAVGRPIGLYGIAGGEIPLGARGEFDHMQSGSQAALAGRNKRIIRSRRWTYHRETRRADGPGKRFESDSRRCFP